MLARAALPGNTMTEHGLSRLECDRAAAAGGPRGACWRRWTTGGTRPRCMAPAAPRGGWSSRRASRSRRWSARCPREVVFTSGGTEANMLALSPSARRCAAGVGDRAPFGARAAAGLRRSRKSRSRPMAWSISLRSKRRLAGRVAAAGLAHARQQRDRRRPAGRAGGRAGACRGRPAACRCGAGAGQDCLRFQGARRRPDDAVGAQDRRAAGRRRADQARCARSGRR